MEDACDLGKPVDFVKTRGLFVGWYLGKGRDRLVLGGGCLGFLGKSTAVTCAVPSSTCGLVETGG